MRPLLFILISSLALSAAAVACGGGGSTETPTQTGTATVLSATPTTGNEKTVTPASTSSVAATAPGETPTVPPVSSVGTPAAAPADQAGFSTSFAGQQVDLQECVYNPGTGVVNCQSVLYAIDPPMVGQDISCQLWVASGTPRAIACHAAEPQGTTYYRIEG